MTQNTQNHPKRLSITEDVFDTLSLLSEELFNSPIHPNPEDDLDAVKAYYDELYNEYAEIYPEPRCMRHCGCR